MSTTTITYVCRLTLCGAMFACAAPAPGAEDVPPWPGRVAAATTQPAGEAMPRRMMWDRTKEAVDAARRVENMQQQLKRAEELAASHPGDASFQRSVDNAQRALEYLRNESGEKLTRWKTPGGATPPKLEKAAYLGVVTSPATPVLQKQLRLGEGIGLLIDYVEPNSPAEAAGLQPFDLIVKLNEQIVVNAHQLAVLVRTFDPGAKVTLKVIREGKERALDVTLVERELKPLSTVVFGPTWTAARPVGGAQASPAYKRSRADAQIRQGDLVNLTLLDLEGPGLQTVVSSRVGKDGTIRAPYLRRPITAEGLSETTLQKSIADAYRSQGGRDVAGIAVERISPNPLAEVGG
jgi:hypothetical protein